MATLKSLIAGCQIRKLVPHPKQLFHHFYPYPGILTRLDRQIFGAGGAIIQKKNKEKEKGKGKEERREKRKKERGEFNLEDPMFLFNFHSFFQKIIK